jgi:crotonobetainyl-CoA:carnitine CoA-transferase CaiB-like acyl-CoA transferase
VLTTYFNDGNRKPVRSKYNNAHAYLSAPYGIYKTKDGYVAIAMTPLPKLGELLDLEFLKIYMIKNYGLRKEMKLRRRLVIG